MDDAATGPVPDLPASAAVLRAGLAMSELDVHDLYLGYVTMGGTMAAHEVLQVLRGERDVSAVEHDYLAQALNDHFTAGGQDHPVAYSEDLDRTVPASRPRRSGPG